MIRAAFIDDDVNDIKKLQKQIKKYEKLHALEISLDCFTCAEHFLSMVKTQDYDILFLDVYLGALSGVELAYTIRETNATVKIVFLTSSKDHAIDSYEVSASHYIVKPIEYSNVSKALSRCLEKWNGKKIQVRVEKVDIPITVSQIDFIEVFDKVCHIHIGNNTIKTYTALKKLQQEINDPVFLRCSRSYLVNMNAIEKVEKDCIYMRSGDTIQIPKNYKKYIYRTFMNFLLGKSD